MNEIPQNLHRDIMRSVKVVKKRYYLFGLFSGLVIGSVIMAYVIYSEMIDQGTFIFLNTFIETLQIDYTLVTEFGDEVRELIPVNNLGIWLVILSLLCLISLIVIRFRKALFLKVDKFRK